MKVCAISDTHLQHMKYDIEMPKADIVIHAGDATFIGDEKEIRAFNSWYSSLDYKYKLYTPGNHDIGFERYEGYYQSILSDKIIYLRDSEITIDGKRIYMAPWSPTFGTGWAFNSNRGPEIKEIWDTIPTGLDILVTHGPPYGYGDQVIEGDRVGCEDLLKAIVRTKPRFSICGHIHHSYGTYIIRDPVTKEPITTVINAAICDESYLPTNKPIVFEI